MAEVTQLRKIHESLTLASSAARTADGNGSEVTIPRSVQAFTWQLDVTAAATDVTDTLDVFIQTTIDGTNWVDVCHFAQVLGNGGAKRYVLKHSATANQAEFETGTALAASGVRQVLGERLRARWAIVDSGDANQSFTFSVVGSPHPVI